MIQVVGNRFDEELRLSRLWQAVCVLSGGCAFLCWQADQACQPM